MEHIIKDRGIGRQEHLIRLERNHEIIQGLSMKLSSYTSEPRYASQFERYIELKNSFRIFEDHQQRLSSMFQESGSEFPEGFEGEIQLQFDRYRQLESDVAGYLLEMEENL